MKPKNLAKLIFAFFICQLAAAAGSIFTFPSIATWYAGIQKPFFNPPNWLFAPVWTILFILMGLALYLILLENWNDKKVKLAISFFSIQLILNILWSVLFFGLQNPLYAFIEIIILWIAIALTIKSFWKISRTAAYLLLPYILWVSIAALLNLSIFLLNP